MHAVAPSIKSCEELRGMLWLLDNYSSSWVGFEPSTPHLFSKAHLSSGLSVVGVGVRGFHVRLLVAGLGQLLVEGFVLLVGVQRASANLGCRGYEPTTIQLPFTVPSTTFSYHLK